VSGSARTRDRLAQRPPDAVEAAIQVLRVHVQRARYRLDGMTAVIPEMNQPAIVGGELPQRGSQCHPPGAAGSLTFGGVHWILERDRARLSSLVVRYRSAPYAWRQRVEQPPQIVGRRRVACRTEHLDGLVGGKAVAVNQPLESHRGLAKPPGGSRGSPLAPGGVAPVEQHAVHHDGEIRAQRALAVELAQDVVLALQEPEMNGLGEVLGVVRRKTTAASDIAGDLAEKIEGVGRGVLVGGAHMSSWVRQHSPNGPPQKTER
jgi:hypothetical protein